MLEHNIITTGDKEATCTVEGYTGDKVCKDCGEVFEKGEIIPKLAHNYKDGKCTVCGAADPNYVAEESSKDNTDTNETTPQTSDENGLSLWLALLLISGTTAACAAARRKF